MNSICHLDLYTKVVSEITGRTIYINDALDQYLISPEWQQKPIAAIVDQWSTRIERLRAENRPPPGLRRAVIALAACATRQAFGDQLNVVLLTEFKDKFSSSSIQGNQRFLVE